MQGGKAHVPKHKYFSFTPFENAVYLGQMWGKIGQNSIPYLSIINEPIGPNLIKVYSGSQMCRLMLNFEELRLQGHKKYQAVS